MTLNAKADFTKTPPTLTVFSDKRLLAKGTVEVGGETAPYSAYLEPKITDDSGRTWTKKTDDGTTAVYTG